MLNGLAPIIIFYFPFKPPSFLPGGQGEVAPPLLSDIFSEGGGLPIPIYLDERLTGIYIDNQTKNLDIETNVQASDDAGKPLVSQRGLTNHVTVNLIAKKDSILLSVLLAMNDMIFSRVVARNYSISYLNGATTILNGLLDGISVAEGTDDDLVRIAVTISKPNLNKTVDTNPLQSVTKVTGTVPTP